MSFAHFRLSPGGSKTIAIDSRDYTLGFTDDNVMLEADEPYSGLLKKEITLYRDDLVFQFDRKDEDVSVRVFSRHGSFDKRSKDWRRLASAFFNLAHNDVRAFGELPEYILQTDEGKACQIYLESRKYDDVDTAGRMITGSRHWYTYLGRSM